MDLKQLHQQYWFHDGVVQSFYLEVQTDFIELELGVNRITRRRPSGQLQPEDLSPCTLKLRFEELIEFSLFDRFPTQGSFIEFTTGDKGAAGIEVEFTVHDAFNYSYEKPNWIIKAKRIRWNEVSD